MKDRNLVLTDILRANIQAKMLIQSHNQWTIVQHNVWVISMSTHHHRRPSVRQVLLNERRAIDRFYEVKET